MEFDALRYSYASRRSVVYGKKGMVATSQPLAAQAGLDMIKKGGNAIDAAIATAACMTVLEPTSNGIGSDAFALIWVKDKLHGLNASGPAPALADAQALIDAGNKEMPKYGFAPVTVPGTPSGWYEMSKKFGKLPFEELFQPAIKYAEEGYPVSPITSKLWNNAFNNFSKVLKAEEYKSWFDTFAPDGRAPKSGEVWKSQGHADTLRAISKTNSEAFYKGELADKIDAYSKKYNGALRKSDLEAFKAEWVEPINVNYRGYDVWEIPPNGHGIVTLMALNILSGYDFKSRDCVDTYHKQIEAMKLAFVDGQRYVTDPKFMRITVEQLLSKEYAAKRRTLINDKAIMPEPGEPDKGGTIYLCTADGDGNMVSYIQSNYMGFGSGLVVPGAGIALHNRGNNFSLDPSRENFMAPFKKPYHTIIPGFLSKGGKAVGPFGVMGGFMQPQGHLQMVMNTIDFGMNPQESLDAPRWQWTGEKNIDVERSFPYADTEELMRMGHAIKVSPDSLLMGRGQIIWRDEHGVLAGGSEPRADGAVMAW